MSRLLLSLLLIFGAGGASALSCVPHDLAETYMEAAASEDRYLVALGQMRFDETMLPDTDWADQANTPQNTGIPARLQGHSLTSAGFTYPYDTEILLNVQCFGPWCARPRSGIRYLAFVNLDRDVPEVSVTPCGGFAFGSPTPEMIAKALYCRNQGACDVRQ